MAFALSMGHLFVRSRELICRSLALRFHLRLAYAANKLLLRKFSAAAFKQTRNLIGAALKTGTFSAADHRLRPSMDPAEASGVHLRFVELG